MWRRARRRRCARRDLVASCSVERDRRHRRLLRARRAFDYRNSVGSSHPAKISTIRFPFATFSKPARSSNSPRKLTSEVSLPIRRYQQDRRAADLAGDGSRMNPDISSQLSRRFIELPNEKRRAFLEQARASGIDLSLLPIPPGIAATDCSPASYAQRPDVVPLEARAGERRLSHVRRRPFAWPTRRCPRLQRLSSGFANVTMSLRTTFVKSADQVVQCVAARAAVSIAYDDLRHLSEDAPRCRCGRAFDHRICQPLRFADSVRFFGYG